MKKRIISILLALSMTVSAGVSALAAPSDIPFEQRNVCRGKYGQTYRRSSGQKKTARKTATGQKKTDRPKPQKCAGSSCTGGNTKAKTSVK